MSRLDSLKLAGRALIAACSFRNVAPPDTLGSSGSPTPFGTGNTGLRTNTTWLPVRDLREARPQDRRESIKTSRWLRNRLGLAAALFEGSARHAIGSGLSPTTDSGDMEYDKRADDHFETLANTRAFDIREEHTFYSLQKPVLSDMMCDGDCGAAKVRDDAGAKRLQLFPTEAIGNTGTERPLEGWRDGIRRNLAGTPLQYRILKEPTPGNYAPGKFDYFPDQFLYIANHNRININRPMPWLNHGHGCAISILDLRELELKRAALNAFFAAVITTPDGEAPDPIADALIQRRSSKTTQKSDGTTTTTDTTRTFADFAGGAAMPVLRTGETINFLKNDGQSATFTGFLDWLVNDIAWGFGVPPQFVWSILGMTGPNARLILQQSDWFFKHLQEIMIQCYCQPIWESIIGDALNTGALTLPKHGGNWKNVRWQGPQSMSIDKGRDGTMYQGMVNSGMLARSEWHEANGKAGRRARTRIIDELAEDIQYCQTKAVPIELYFGTHPGQMSGPPSANPLQKEDPEKLAQDIVTALLATSLFSRAAR